MKIHTLANGATLISLSAHPFRFSDGTVSEPQDESLVKRFTLHRQLRRVGEIKGMALNQVSMILNHEQLDLLREICGQADLVLLPFPVLTALREMQVRLSYPNAVAFNATEETQRAAPDAKIVDINNWSY